MNQEKIETYDRLVCQCKVIADAMSVDDLQEYNEILLSSHSCGIEGN